MKPDDQLELWVKGTPVHNKDRDECCPDFSCCKPELLADVATREAFYRAYKEKDGKTTGRMLGMFLGAAIAAASDKKVHIVDPDAHEGVPLQ